MTYELVYPMAAMVVLTFGVMFAMFRARVRAVRAGEADAGYFKTYQEGREPRHTAQLSRQVTNLFETPVLFYVACVTAMVTELSGLVMVVLAWLYVGLRIAHAWVHTGSNRLGPRVRIYGASWLVLLAMWTILVLGVAGIVN
ncbi:MAG: MAPEG family protein [Gammaproteobacteria bacterium]|nr:MAPEG family protein [Gammaproteobacteria bacterium]MDH5240780.1 MAPEG family protein [Gammaproteobacteria bacterium]MDH5262819.1 MAPEG family protein [Gammaproteobacteria bacterium]MDH5583201.1 MAPEG family protein [Gammaproteobacteria bacterium]